MITGSVYGKKELIERVRSWLPNVRTALKRAVTEQAVKLQAHVVKNKLTGQVLHVRTGTLRRSINMRIEEAGSKVVGSVGTNVRYGAFWEFGFDGVESVREHLRKLKNGAATTVRAHERSVSVAARSFLRSALADRADDIRAALTSAVKGAVR